jgi:type I restriction-modification system DNA methylase subunit
MSNAMWDKISRVLLEHTYMGEIERTAERVKLSGEVFTPTPLVVEMLSRLPLEVFAPGKLVLDPACGDGQFLLAAKWVKILHFKMSEEGALSEIFGVDIMRDNVELCKSRLGGGHIVLGDSLTPDRKIKGQTPEEYRLLQQMLGSPQEQMLVWEG